MSLESAKEYLKNYGLDSKIIEFDGQSSATVELAAQAIGCAPERIAKSLALQNDGSCFIIVVAGDARLDNRKFKDTFHFKARMLDTENTLEKTGHPVGGVCPFGLAEGIAVYLDVSLKRFDSVYPACGSTSSAIHLTLEELEKTSGYLDWVDVCKSWDE